MNYTVLQARPLVLMEQGLETLQEPQRKHTVSREITSKAN